jgi:hypothetical protein
MAQFYVYHSTPMRRARVHFGDCAYCRNGQGMENQDKNGSGATGWDGPFATLEKANAKMASLKFENVGRCKYCLEA